MRHHTIGFLSFVAGICFAVTTLAASPSTAAEEDKVVACDESLAMALELDELTEVVLIKLFRKGEALALSGDAEAPWVPPAANDLCLVKLLVGPGNPGPADAPSTSRGIGIEIWLPSHENWNERIHAVGGGGFQGGVASFADQLASPFMAAAIAGNEGAVSSITDAGHSSEPKNYGIPDASGDFLMNPDGSINDTLWQDFAHRAIHQQAVQTKAVTAAYYGRPARFAYWDGSSTGGRQGHMLAQMYPEDFDGIVANLPALHWTRLLVAMVYPQLVFQRDLGGKPLTIEQLDLVSNAAIAACDLVGGRHLGYIPDPSQCRYDPTRDPGVLCISAGGQNASAACVTEAQARAVNKIWYGITRDGSVPDPERDNGWNLPPEGRQLWYGLARGTSLWNAYFSNMLGRPAGAAHPEAEWFLATDQLALQMEDASLAGEGFRNASTARRNGWKSLSYEQLAEAFQRGAELNPRFGHVDADNPDLSAFAARGGKLLSWHGTNDEVIPVQGSMQYYDSVVERMGGLERVQDFYRLYIVPGAGHQSPNGTSNPDASPPIFHASQLYEMLVNWVENGVAPERVDLHSPPDAPERRSQPVCPYPARAAYTDGDSRVAESYVCRQ